MNFEGSTDVIQVKEAQIVETRKEMFVKNIYII